MPPGKSKERLQPADDNINQFLEVLQRRKDRINLHNLRFIERYVELECHILLHFTIGGSGVEYVAFLHRDFSEFFVDADRGKEINRRLVGKPFGKLANDSWRDAVHLILRADRQQQSVFTDVVKFVQAPKVAVREDAIRRTFVWFDRADYVYNILPKARYLSDSNGFVFRGRETNGESEVLRGDSSLVLGSENLVDRVIQSAPEVLGYVTNNCRDNKRHLPNVADVIDDLSRIRIALSPDRVSVGLARTKSENLSLHITEVLFGPFNFYPDSADSSLIHNPKK